MSVYINIVFIFFEPCDQKPVYCGLVIGFCPNITWHKPEQCRKTFFVKQVLFSDTVTRYPQFTLCREKIYTQCQYVIIIECKKSRISDYLIKSCIIVYQCLILLIHSFAFRIIKILALRGSYFYHNV